MTVKEISVNIMCLEYRQNREDADYGSCLWARFYFNLDRYELMIMSDCGNYGYKWVETPDSESFLELMARCESGYILDKIYGRPDIFDYDITKEKLYDLYGENEEDIAKLDEILESIECEYIPETGSDFIRMFDEENDGYFYDTWDLPAYVHPSNAKKICQVFKDCIRPKIREILKDGKEYKPEC